MKRQLKNFMKWSLFRCYRLGTRRGDHITPIHDYSPVPNIIKLERTRSEPPAEPVV
ncbi:MAG: hypothetical protein ACYSU7_06385 [Planctomycetota bacterium]|jgi:hypothetical protein